MRRDIYSPVLGLSLVAVLLASGCPPKKDSSAPKSKPKGVTCKFSPHVLGEMKAVLKSKSGWPQPMDQMNFMGLTAERCSGWPALFRTMFAAARERRSFAAAAYSVSQADRQEMNRRLTRFCPAYAKGLTTGPTAVSAERYRTLWRVCHVSDTGLMSRRSFIAGRPQSLIVFAMYHLLAAGGLEKPLARLLANFWGGDEWHAVERAGLLLPVSGSTTVPLDAPDVTVHRQWIRSGMTTTNKLVNEKVSGDDKRDGPDGFFVDSLYKILSGTVRRMRAAERQGGDAFRGLLSVAADRRLRFRLVSEVLYTANQAEFKHYQLVVRHPEAPNTTVLLAKPMLMRTECVSRYRNVLWVEPNGYWYRLGVGTKVQRLPFTSATRPRVTRQLTAALTAGAPARTKWTKAAALRIIPAPRVTFGDLVRTLDAVRTRPPRKSAAQTPAKGVGQDCALRFDKARARWAPVNPRRCLYPLPRLLFGAMGRSSKLKPGKSFDKSPCD